MQEEVDRQAPLVDSTADQVTEARGKVRDSAKQTFKYRTGR